MEHAMMQLDYMLILYSSLWGSTSNSIGRPYVITQKERKKIKRNS